MSPGSKSLSARYIGPALDAIPTCGTVSDARERPSSALIASQTDAATGAGSRTPPSSCW